MKTLVTLTIKQFCIEKTAEQQQIIRFHFSIYLSAWQLFGLTLSAQLVISVQWYIY